MKLKIKKLDRRAIIPQAQRRGDAGLDISALEDNLIKAGQRIVVNTGLSLAIPEGYWGNIRDRSGLALEHGLHTMGGVIDANYRGELKIILINLSDQTYQIKAGDRIAQLIISPYATIETAVVEELDETDRGRAGFNSSGY